MNDLFEDFLRILNAFEQHEVDYVLVGGFAVMLHGMERLTRDIDIFVKNSPENIANVREALRMVFHDEAIAEITSDELKKYSVIRYGTPKEFYVDIMTQLGDAVAYENLAHEVIEYEGVRIKLATPETLYRLKRDTVRERDKYDAQFLQALIQSRKS